MKVFEMWLLIYVVNDQRGFEVMMEFLNSRILKNVKCEIVHFNKKFQLCMCVDFDPKRIWHIFLHIMCSPWCPLGWHAKSGESLVWKFWNIGAQSGDQIIMGRFDHYSMWPQFLFEFDLIGVSMIHKVVIWV